MSTEATVYLGAPIGDYTPTRDDDADAYNSKIGGMPAWLRPVIPSVDGGSKARQGQCARCPRCRSAANLRLLTQIHAPLEVYDRILYLFMCASCSTPQESIVCAFRSQVYNPSYDTDTKAASETTAANAASSAAKESLFAVDDEDGWGDENTTDNVEEPSAAPASSSAAAATPAAKPIVFPSATAADNEAYSSALTRPPLPSLLLDTFPEPEGAKEKATNKSVAEQLAEVEALYPGITEVSAEAVEADKLPTTGKQGGGAVVFVDDDGPSETPDEQASAEFFARLARCPTQCIRWSPNGLPLLSSHSRRPPTIIPPCPSCGAPRVFEFQLLSPAVYFFEKMAKATNNGRRKVPEAGSKAAKQQTIAAVEGTSSDPHFSTVSVYTCASHCYTADNTVTLEYAHLEPEL